MERKRTKTEPRIEAAERFAGELAMLMPIYVPGGGDMTEIVTEGGERWIDPRPVPLVLKSVARYYGVDLVAVRERYGDILGRRLNVPLPLSPHLVLIPLKMRLPRVQKDGTTGYVATRCIERIRPCEEPNRCCLLLGGVVEVECLQSLEFVKQQVRRARIVETFYRERMSLGATAGLSAGVSP
jgi:hypothetical protein